MYMIVNVRYTWHFLCMKIHLFVCFWKVVIKMRKNSLNVCIGTKSRYSNLYIKCIKFWSTLYLPIWRIVANKSQASYIDTVYLFIDSNSIVQHSYYTSWCRVDIEISLVKIFGFWGWCLLLIFSDIVQKYLKMKPSNSSKCQLFCFVF